MIDPRDEIERLKAQLENLAESHLGQRVLIAAMSEERDGMKKLVEQATVEIERLRAERDDARDQAERWGDDAMRLLNERNAAQRERDEARREVCYASTQPPRECAVDRGWDCFKEDGK